MSPPVDPDATAAVHAELERHIASLAALPVLQRVMPDNIEPLAQLVAQLPRPEQEVMAQRLLDRQSGLLKGVRADTWRAEVARAALAPQLTALQWALGAAVEHETDPDCLKAMRAVADVLVQADKLTYNAGTEEVRRLFRQHGHQHVGEKLLAAALEDAKAALRGADDQQSRAIRLRDPEPWDTEVDGAVLLDTLVATVQRFVILTAHVAELLALWVLHTFAVAAFDISPYLANTSPTKRCGKTTLLKLLRRLVRRPLAASNLTPATVFRTIEAYRPTLLLDEVENYLKDKGDEIVGILNAGHDRELAFVLRTVKVDDDGEGADYVPAAFSTFCPKAFALIGKLPDTLADRSIENRMRRKQRSERVERLRRNQPDLEPLRRQAARWAADHLEALREADPAVPEELNDREADSWSVLLAIADLAGGDWPARARQAALALSGVTEAEDEGPRVALLADIRAVFAQLKVDRLSSAQLVTLLTEPLESRWRDWRGGRPLSQYGLARLLRDFDIQPKSIRPRNIPGVGDDAEVLRGYELAQFEDAFLRYLDPLRPLPAHDSAGLQVKSDPLRGAGVADANLAVTTSEPRAVADVADENPLAWAAAHVREAQATSGTSPVRVLRTPMRRRSGAA